MFDYDLIITSRGPEAFKAGLHDKINKLSMCKTAPEEYTIIQAANGQRYRIDARDAEKDCIKAFFGKIARRFTAR